MNFNKNTPNFYFEMGKKLTSADVNLVKHILKWTICVFFIEKCPKEQYLFFIKLAKYFHANIKINLTVFLFDSLCLEFKRT